MKQTAIAAKVGRRGFLGSLLAGAAYGQLPPAVVPLPAKAKITCSVMLWTLSGTFEKRVKIAALAGMQAVGLLDEYTAWDEAALKKARRQIESFGMTVETVSVAGNIGRAIRVAKQMEAPYLIAAGGIDRDAGEMAAAAEVTLLTESVAAVREADNPRIRLLFDGRQADAAASFKEQIDYTAMIYLPDAPLAGEFYRALAKEYGRSVAIAFKPRGDAVVSLKKAVDQFRAGVNERAVPAAPTEGSLV